MKSEENTSPNVSVKSKTMKRFSKAADKELNANFSEGGGVVVNSKLIKTKYKTGRWTDDEHNRFLEAIEKYGRDWKRVQQHVGTRSSTQSRSHAQKFFRKINLTDVKPGIGLIKHKSLNVASRCVKKLKVTEEESSDEELLV